ncbi:hypothetical protein IID19_05070 [Patescibacteria group bacterium]|nr:hypothetical protein [Patescibacteria group bacterium]
MKDRKKAILSAIIDEHVAGGRTVASKSLVDKIDFQLSPATIRNEMASLEREGLIYQPHTSAGRIPTEKGWQYYIENFLNDEELVDEQKEIIEQTFNNTDKNLDSAVKEVAKCLAEISQDAVFVGFGENNVYYTGLSNLFKQPEFKNIDLVFHMSEIVDHLDDVIAELFNDVTDAARVLVGTENPFGNECSTIFGAYQIKGKEPGLFGILGPMRMDYKNNLALVNYTKKLFSNT